MAWTYRPQLDGLRTVAVGLVLLFHAGIGSAAGGFIGVDLFFVLSGFLVTNVILSGIDAHGRFHIGDFYLRRVRRLLPAAVVVVVATCAVQVLVTPLPSRIGLVGDARAALLYFANWQFIIDARDYFGTGIDGSPFLHFWSLSIEEQFYVVYPLLVLLLVGLARFAPRRAARERLLALLVAALLIVSVLWQVLAARSDINYAYYATQTRLYQLMAGALLAILMRRATSRAASSTAAEGEHRQPGPRRLAPAIGTLGVVALLALGSDLVALSQSNRGLLATIAGAAAIGGLTNAPTALFSRVLGAPWPRYLGKISYGIYLWHWPVLLVIGQLMNTSPWIRAILGAAISCGLAALSYELIERPIRAGRQARWMIWPLIATSLAISVTMAFTLVPTLLERPARPAVANATTAGPQIDFGSDATPVDLDSGIPKNLDFEKYSRDRGDEGPSCTSTTPKDCIAVRGTGQTVLLVGDSHAAMLVPAFEELAAKHDFTLATNVLASCAWQPGLTVTRTPVGKQEECAETRSVLPALLDTLQPDVVVAIGKARSDGHWTREVVADDADEHPGEDYPQMISRVTADGVDELTSTGAKLILVDSFFGTGGYDAGGPNPLDCLSVAKKQGDCVVVPPPAQPMLDSVYGGIAAARADVATVNLRSAYCPGPVCPPIIDGVVTWKDPDHLSRDYVLRITDRIWQSLRTSGMID